MYVPVDLVNEGAKMLQVSHYIFIDSKAPWFKIADDGKQHMKHQPQQQQQDTSKKQDRFDMRLKLHSPHYRGHLKHMP